MSRLQDVLLIGDRASQPLATAVATGTLYTVNDEAYLIEQSDGATWEQFGPAVGGGGDGFFDRLAVGDGALLDAYSAVYMGSTAFFVENVQTEITDFSLDYVVGFNAGFSLNPSATVTIPCYAIAGILWSDAANTEDFTSPILGVYGEAAHYGSGDATAGIRGVDGWGVLSGSGVVGTATFSNTGACALFAEGWGVDNGGSAFYAQGVYIRPPLVAGAGADIGEADAIRICDVDVAGITTARVLRYEGTGLFTIDKDSNMSTVAAYIEGSEMTAPSAPAANGFRIFARDTGGKTELCARFNTGAIVPIVIEP